MTSGHDRAWYERRLTGFGASDAPALLGLSRWKTTRQLVEEKARRIIPDPDAPERLRLRIGREMEPLLARHLVELATERGVIAHAAFHRSGRLYRMAGYPFVVTNVDGFVDQDSALVELKTDAFGFEPWGDEDGDPARVVPAMYFAQVQHALAATGRQRALLFVLIGLGDRKLYVIPREDDYIANLIAVEEPYWMAVEEGRRRLAADPDADIDDLLPAEDYANTRAAAIVRKRFVDDDGEVMPTTSEQELLIGRLRQAVADVGEAERRKAAIETEVIAAIGPHAGLSSTLGTVTYKKAADSVVVDWSAVAAEYRAIMERYLQMILRGDADTNFLHASDDLLSPPVTFETLDAIEDDRTTTKEGTRRIYTPRGWKKAGTVAGEEGREADG